MNPNEFDPLPSAAQLLGDEIEVQALANRLWLAEDRYDMDTSFERRQISMSMRAAYHLLGWLYQHRDAIRQRAQEEAP